MDSINWIEFHSSISANKENLGWPICGKVGGWGILRNGGGGGGMAWGVVGSKISKKRKTSEQ